MFVLVVDDDPIARMTHLAMLAKLPEVRAVGSASVAEARQVIAAQQPDAALVDMQLPDGTGLEVISLLEQRGHAALVLVVSAEQGPDKPLLHPRLQRLCKPVQLKDLARLVGSAPLPPDRAVPFSVRDYVQLASAGAYSARLLCANPAGSGAMEGEILILDGQLWSARDDKGAGPAALYRLAAAGRILVTREPEPSARPPRNLTAAGQQLSASLQVAP